MNTNEINQLLSNYECFIGTFARDLLPKSIIKKRPIALIVNTDKSDKPGQHWLGLFLATNGSAEVFDSFGINKLHNEILNFLKINNVKKLIYNPRQLQSITTSTCGAYCVLFVKFRCSGLDFCDVINLFTNDFIKNDFKAYLSLLF